jgi:hypothetical protein
VVEDVGIRTGFSDLKIWSNRWPIGVLKIALSFTPQSFLSSEAVSMFMRCIEMLQEHGAALAFIHPNEQIL